ncbi:ABC transporter ATP-binding protein [Paenibacillus radicis (ex Gao et al. 2016)]|uniref:ABC transporter ATP-binding protein n=1 Tax=Paenibacillus radicis (ex Gao et al. 2016) TaxID=1737354 RepID=A0A917HTE1_9BACL|nr:ABC transporter ATP-binding protein [Paenibacillus radicis (ex Gao et al. 2016)]GGG89743.1 ABC transporter ATP-binding protein [Paenibacillus radicis (ex Gao et al. 2016)]
MNFVKFRDVVKKYDTILTVNHLNFDIAEGEVFGLLGPNGAGKSTTIEMLAGLLEINSGDITVDGFSIRKQPLEVKKRIGIVPQELAIYEGLSARDNVTFFARLYGLSGKLLKERVDEALRFVGLLERAKDLPSTFSGGMKRRLNIACAIMHRPKLIVMDEPTVGIDPQSRNHILESVRELNRLGSTIIYTSHYMEEIEALCSRIGIMDEGKLIAIGTKEQLKKQSGQEERLVFEVERSNAQALSEMTEHPAVKRCEEQAEDKTIEVVVKDSPSVLQDLLFILQKHGIGLRKITRVEPNLETLFLQMTGRKLRDE